jgi:hypothetical protein
MSELLPCPECRRHVRKRETECPFCGKAISLSEAPPHALPRRRLNRAATFAFGAGVVGVTTLVACGETEVQDGRAVYGAPPSAGTGGSSYGGSAIYGAPPSGAPNGGTGGSADQGGSIAVYGAPTAGTGGVPGGGDAGAAGADAAGAGGFDGGGTLYGGPPK